MEQVTRLIPGKQLKRLFTSVKPKRISELTNKAMELDAQYKPPNFLNYFGLECRNEAEAKRIANRLSREDAVALTYIETVSADPPSPNKFSNPLSPYQKYLNPAPLGIDARYAWQFRGGNGDGNIKFIDIEQGWIFDHEDLKVNQLPCTGLSHYEHKDHGTAVLGVIMMQDNKIGGIGITPKAKGYVVSQWRQDGTFNTADAIMAAIGHLDFGDILLLEAETFDVNTDNIWPVEIMDANFQAIRLATAVGIIVVEAAGNGMDLTGNDLDFFADHHGQTIFNRSNDHFKDSGAIVVAAASGRLPHTRINYSNYGSRIDCFAWGEDVATAGSFPHSSGPSTDSYSEDFSGTSSASAIIAGAVIAVQGIVDANFGFRISPIQMRNILSNKINGTNSANGHRVDKIGVMPDLKKIIDHALNSLPLPRKKRRNRGQAKSLPGSGQLIKDKGFSFDKVFL